MLMVLRVEDTVDSLVVRIIRIHLHVGQASECEIIIAQRTHFNFGPNMKGLQQHHVHKRALFKLLDRARQNEGLNPRITECLVLDALQLGRMLIVILERDRSQSGTSECLGSQHLNASGNPDVFNVRFVEGLSADHGHPIRDRNVRRLTRVGSEDAARDHEVICRRGTHVDHGRSDFDLTRWGRHGSRQLRARWPTRGMYRGGRPILLGGQRPHRGGVERPGHVAPLKRGSQERVDEQFPATCDCQRGFWQLDPSLLGHGTDLDADSVCFAKIPRAVDRGYLRIARGMGGDDTVRIHGRHGFVRRLPGEIGTTTSVICPYVITDRLDGDALPRGQCRTVWL